MYCTNCGAQLPSDSKKCDICGTVLAPPVQQQQQPAYYPPPPPPQQAYGQQPPQGYGQPPFSPPPGMQPPAAAQDYLALNIILTILSVIGCCFSISCLGIPLGIAGIIYSSNARKAYAAGDLYAGNTAAKTAKTLFIIGAVILALSIAFGVLAAIFGWSKQWMQMSRTMRW